jgi:hypothetical protein
MAKLKGILVDIEAALALLPPSAITGPATIVWSSAYRDDLERLLPGELKYQLRYQNQLERISSNVSYETAAVEVVVLYHLTPAQPENDYTEGLMLTWMSELLDRNWWTGASAGIYQLEDDGHPDTQEEVSRDGNILSYSVLCTFEIVPE